MGLPSTNCRLLSGLLFLSLPVNAQLSPWRYSVDVGVSHSLNKIQFNDQLPPGLATAEGRTGFAGGLTLERSISKHVSTRLGIGVMTSRLVRGTYSTEYNASGQVISFGGRGSETANARPLVGSLGLQWNSNLVNRCIFTAGIDATVQGNTGALDTRPAGSGIVFGKVSAVNYGHVNYTYFPLNSYPTGTQLSWGTSFRAGLDFRLASRSFISLNGFYHKGFQTLRQYIDLVQVAGQPNQVVANNTGDYVSLTVGLKRILLAKRASYQSAYTAYTAPYQRSDYAIGEDGFQRTDWTVGLRGGYWPGSESSTERTSYLTVRINRFLSNRLAAGLVFEDYWIRPSGLSHIRSERLSAGPYLRFNLTDTKFVPFIEAAYQVGVKRVVADYAQTYNYWLNTYSVTPGIGLWLQNNLWLELALSFRPSNERHLISVNLPSPLGSGTNVVTPLISEPYNGPLPQLGLTYRFATR